MGEKELSWLWIRLELQNSHVCLSQMSPTVSQSYSYWNHKNEAFTFIIISFKWRILCHLKLTFTASVTKELLGFVCLIVFWSGKASGYMCWAVSWGSVSCMSTPWRMAEEKMLRTGPGEAQWWRPCTACVDAASTARAGTKEKRKIWKCWKLDLRGTLCIDTTGMVHFLSWVLPGSSQASCHRQSQQSEAWWLPFLLALLALIHAPALFFHCSFLGSIVVPVF